VAAAPVSGALVEVATYARRVRASAERVWENVHDFEHLPYLHAGSFRSIQCRHADAQGWRASVGLASGAEIDLELALAPDGRSYHSRTLAGPGAGTDVWTEVAAIDAHATDVAVHFLLPAPLSPAGREKLGAAFVHLYTRLWDEDEAMMQRRQAFLDGVAPRVPRPGARPPQSLGSVDALRARLPLVAAVGDDRFVVREHAGQLVAHAAACPHWGAELAGARIEGGALVCPWHGYRFDLASGRGPASQRCRMPARARVRVAEGGEAWLEVS
jgi:nitrite reductase/ring-hydroxylating ferredoxin subunit